MKSCPSSSLVSRQLRKINDDTAVVVVGLVVSDLVVVAAAVLVGVVIAVEAMRNRKSRLRGEDQGRI